MCLDNIIIFTLSSYIISKFVIQYLEKVLLENKIFTLSFFIFTLLVFIVDLILSIKYNYNCSKKKGWIGKVMEINKPLKSIGKVMESKNDYQMR